MSNTYSAGNTAWRQKMEALVGRLEDPDFGKTVGSAGWTIAGLLGHLAFWDRRALLLLDKWKKSGIGDSPMDTDLVNEAMRPFLNALQPRVAAKLALDAAASIDAAIDGLAPAFLAQVESEGKPVRLSRAAHREHHLAQIQKALESKEEKESKK